MDFINPPVGEINEIKAFVDAMCQLLFEYANPVDEGQRKLLNRIDADVGHAIQVEAYNAQEGIERKLAEQMPS